jgi:dihydroneopterin aldolase
MGLTVELVGLELHGHHGAFEDERQRGQRFVYDIRLEVGEAAATSDRLADAVDYRDVVAVVRDVSDGSTFRLLEALAAAVAEELVLRFQVSSAEVRVRKPDVVLAAPVEYAAVTARRGQ